MSRSCIFCSGDSKLTREHIIPVWLQRYVGGELGNERRAKFRGTHLNPIGMPLSQRVISGDSHTAKIVCGDCSHGWMSRLETEFAVLLPRLQTATTPRNFSKAERLKIALWAKCELPSYPSRQSCTLPTPRNSHTGGSQGFLWND